MISPKEKLIAERARYETYSVWGDATHWTQRGAFIGYQLLMETIDAKNGGRYRILQEEDYDITVTDQGETLFGGIHRENNSEDFRLRAPAAAEARDRLGPYADDQTNDYFVNESAGNDTCVLFVCDSYFRAFLMDDIAQSFHDTVFINGTPYLDELPALVEQFHPDIVVVENAERADRSHRIAKAAQAFLAEE